MSNTDLEIVINKAFDEKEMVNAQTKGEIRDAVTEALARLCLLYTSPSPRDGRISRMPSSA